MPSVDISNIWLDLKVADLLPYEDVVARAHERLMKLSEDKSSKTGWLTFPLTLESTDIAELSAVAEDLRQKSDAVVVIGAGGSYLGSRAVVELLNSPYFNETDRGPKLYFSGHNLSTRELDALTGLLENREFSVVVISKSGTTLEPALSFRHFRRLLEDRYGEKGAKSRIVAVTDGAGGLLRKMADSEGWQSFVIPDNIGGRYSVFTAAGLLPMALAGVSIRSLLVGARNEAMSLEKRSMENPAWQYAAARSMLYMHGKKIELLACYEPAFRYAAEWWKQLFGESEGKKGRGIFPASVQYTTDLHSLGQYVQEGERTLFETLVRFSPSGAPIRVESDLNNADSLNYLAGQELGRIQTVAENAVISAHTAGGVPCIIIEAGEITERNIGALLYFFQLSCALSGIMLGVDPFDQPGVEAYKKNMFEMLRKMESLF